MSDKSIAATEWACIVQNVPIVSVDLVVLLDGAVLLGLRENEPAKGEWFVPGGRVKKHERLSAAVHRVAQNELGVDVTIVKELGVYEHLYDTADIPDAGGKHYLANGFVVRPTNGDFAIDDQHDEVRLFDLANLPALHQYVRTYLTDADVEYST